MTTDAGQAGTTTGAGGNAPDPQGTTGTPPAADRDAGTGDDRAALQARVDELERQRAQHLAEKDTWQKRQAAADSGAQSPPTGDRGQEAWASDMVNDVMAEARAGNKLAQFAIYIAESQHQNYTGQINDLKDQLQRLEIPETQRAEVDEAMKSGRFTNRTGAREFIEAVKKAQKVDDLERQIGELKTGNQQREAGHTGTFTARPITGNELGATDNLTRDQARDRLRDESAPMAERASLRKKLEDPGQRWKSG